MSLPEVLLWQCLRPKNNKDFRLRRQAALLPGITVDFYYATLRIAFEIDGQIHAGREKEDNQRDSRLRAAGYKVVRIPARNVLKSPTAVADYIRLICLGEIDDDFLD
jgi:very-short-patch-repair endonuclease